MRSNILPLTLLLAAMPLAAQQQPFPVHDVKPVITHGPYLVAPTETSVTVAWTTDIPCHAKVVYGTGNSLTGEAENAEHGLLPIGLHHAVTVTGLEPGKTYRYRAVSTPVVKMKSYWPEKGLPAESETCSFTTFDRRKPAFSFSLITDTHADAERIQSLTGKVDWKTTDFLVHLGDAFAGVEDEEMIFSKFIDPLSAVLAHRLPLVSVRGNHDTRGPAARSMPEYLPIPDGRFYYSRDHGPVHFIVLDTGEDKDDNTNVYARLNRFKVYREEEFNWFAEHARTDSRNAAAPFRILLMHAPNWGWVDGAGDKWTELANRAGTDLSISGHTHRFSHSKPGEKGRNYHELVIGPQDLARVEVTAGELKVVVTKRDGTPVESFSVPAKRR